MAYIHLAKITGPELRLSLLFYWAGINSVYFSTLFRTALARIVLTVTTLLPVNSEMYRCPTTRREGKKMELHSLLASAPDVGEWSASRPGRFTLGNLLNRSRVGSHSQAGLLQKTSFRVVIWMRTGIVYTTATGRPFIQGDAESRDGRGNTLKIHCRVSFVPPPMMRPEFGERFILNAY
jgi:hypothetical protein